MNTVIGAAIPVIRSPNPGILRPKVVNVVGINTVVPWIEAVGAIVGGITGANGKNDGASIGKLTKGLGTKGEK